MKKKVAYGEDKGTYCLLRPLKHVPFMVPLPCSMWPNRVAAEAAAEEHGYIIEWDAS